MCLRVRGHNEVMESERAEHAPKLAIGLQRFHDDGIVAGADGKLMDRSVGVSDSPLSVAQQAADLWKQKYSVEGLIRSRRSPTISRTRIEVIEAHKIEIVRSRQEKC